MERLIERVGGLDMHKQTVAACVRVPGSKEHSSSTCDLWDHGGGAFSLARLAGSHGVTHVAMESTGVYWKS